MEKTLRNSHDPYKIQGLPLPLRVEALSKGQDLAGEVWHGRLADKILTAFDCACEVRDFVTAAELLKIVERVIYRQPSVNERRKKIETLVTCHRRIWDGREADPDQAEPIRVGQS